MVASETAWPHALGLHAGDWVVVRSPQEIFSTLDGDGRLDGLPFQPEMLAFCGQRLRVSKVAHKTCDTIKKTGGRRMVNAVHLERSRCNGSGHGNCMADCLFFWKEAWLKRPHDQEHHALSGALMDAHGIQQCCTVQGGDLAESDPIYVCQMTALYEATSVLHWWDVRQYVQDVTSGNHSLLHMCRIFTFAVYRKLYT